MKLKTSCCKTALKKDITRFWPVWAGYLFCLLCGMVLLISGGLDYGFPRDMTTLPQLMGIVNAGYGLIVAVVLFSDLYNPRLCSGIHALPLKRENWFGVHVCAGLLFNLVPSVVMAILAAVGLSFSSCQNGWQIALWWLLGTNLQYLFFFGAALLAAMLSGSRTGAVLVYGLMQLGAVLVLFLINTVYVPMLYGVVLDQEPFLLLSPMVRIADMRFMDWETVYSPSDPSARLYSRYWLTGDWWYLWVIAAVGIVLGALALWCYRRRNLERAGDLLGTRRLNPVFQVVFALVGGSLLQFLVYLFLGTKEFLALLFLGVALGWFAGAMLIRRSTRVFSLKSFLSLGAVLLVLGISLWLTAADAFGIESRIPKKEEIVSVKISRDLSYGDNITLTEAEDIENVLFMHTAALAGPREDVDRYYRYKGQVMEDGITEKEWDPEFVEYRVGYQLTYTLTGGRQVIRSYSLWPRDPEGLLLSRYMSHPRTLSGKEDFRLLTGPLLDFRLGGGHVPEKYWTDAELRSLLEALQADAQAGSLAQDSELHVKYFLMEADGSHSRISFWIRLEFEGEKNNGLSLRIFPDAENTWRWFESRGLLEQENTFG